MGTANGGMGRTAGDGQQQSGSRAAAENTIQTRRETGTDGDADGTQTQTQTQTQT